MKRLILLVFILSIFILPNSLHTQSQVLNIDHRHSVVGFTVKIAGGLSDAEGVFTQFEGAIEYDENTTDVASVSAKIEVASVNTGVAPRDNHLKHKDFFDAEKYPQITFYSDQVTTLEEYNYQATGQLTIKEKTREVQFTFKRNHSKPVVWLSGTPVVVFEGHLSINRKDYGVQANPRWNQIIAATGELAMSDEVQIRLKIIAEGANAAQLVLQEINEQGLKRGIEKFHDLSSKLDEIEGAVNLYTLNEVGYELLDQNQTEAAIKIFELNVKQYPQEPNVYDSLGEAYKLIGNKKQAILNYQKVLALDPGNENAVKMLDELKK